MRLKVIIALLIFTISFNIVKASTMLFYEPFDNTSTILNNSGSVEGSPTFRTGLLDNAINLSGSKKVCYPLENNFNDTNGTIEFWVKPPSDNGLGFFDVGGLMNPNSWGIFKNVDYAIMEVKNNVNSYDQAWSPNPFIYDGRWHFIAAVWERENETTYFKICLDAECKNYYDGVKSNSYPNLTKDFCVGWNLWYGYSESLFDEFKIFDYVKSDEEIKEDYLALVNNTIENKTKKECIMYKPESSGPVKINWSGLYVNNKPFTAEGVGYQPIPIGMTADIPGGANVVFNSPEVYNRDFPLLREMNANTIRTWAKVTNKSFLDAAYNNGVNPIYVVMGFWINCNENYGDSVIRQKYIGNFTEYVTEFKDHPAVLVWALGNENNLGYCSNSAYIDDFYLLCNELAKVAYEIEGNNYHPVGVVNGDILNIGFSAYNSDDESMNYTDFWASNVYPGKTFGTWFDDYAALTGKPLLITEYGIDALNNTNKQEYEDTHAEWVINQWTEINYANITIGSTLMAYSDEWWKAGSPSSHDYGGYVTDRHPDGYSNEEWWGVMRTVDNGNDPDIMQKRKIYYSLQNAFGEKVVFNISLDGGWNLISIPLNLFGVSIQDIFGVEPVIYAYNGSWFVPDEIDNKLGYWVKVNQSMDLTLNGTEIMDKEFELDSGWNLVGYPYLEEKSISELSNATVYAYKNSEWYSYNPDRSMNSLDKFTPGYGYWVKEIS